MDNIKKFNIYVFLSSFARNLIEIFIGTILYKSGFSLKEVILYYLIVNIVSLILTPLFVNLSKKFSNRNLAIIAIISFTILQLALNNVYNNIIYLISIATLFAIYRRGYWISRRFYNLKVISKENITKSFTITSIINQIAIIASAYIGSLLLDFVSIKLLTIISISLFLLSLLPLYKLKFDHEYNDKKLNLRGTLKEIGIGNAYLLGSYELLNVIKFLFPLYLFIYVQNTYQVIGIVSLIVSGATILFSYTYGRFIDKEKSYLKISIILISIIFIFKANTVGILLCIISFLEGLITKAYELSNTKNFILLSKKFEYYNYNYAYEFLQNFFRSLVVLILYLFIGDLRIMIYVTLFFVLIGCLITFKISNIENYKL